MKILAVSAVTLTEFFRQQDFNGLAEDFLDAVSEQDSQLPICVTPMASGAEARTPGSNAASNMRGSRRKAAPFIPRQDCGDYLVRA
jgi:hypothetical protein